VNGDRNAYKDGRHMRSWKNNFKMDINQVDWEHNLYQWLRIQFLELLMMDVKSTRNM
jgi:hypothetical protein